jgi:hypothetical protein
MRRRWALSWLVIVACAALIGYTSWQAFWATGADYRPMLPWQARWITAASPETAQAFFRKTLHLTATPAHAWLAVKAPDEYTLFVNARAVETRTYRSGYAQNVIDLTPFLRIGPNTIAIVNRINTFPQRPRVAVQGQYVERSGRVMEFRSDASWRVALRDETLVSQDGAVEPTPWFHPRFDDGRWAGAVEGALPNERETEPVAFPPSLITRPLPEHWMWAGGENVREAYLRLPLELAERPRVAWMRLAAHRHYRLMVNGVPVAIVEDAIGTTPAEPRPVALHDIAPFLQRGHNVVAIQASSESSDRGILADGFVIDPSGQLVWFSASSEWRASAHAESGWARVGFDDTRWGAVSLVRPLLPADRPPLADEISEPVTSPSPVAPFRVLLISLAACLALWVSLGWIVGGLTGIAATTAMRQVVSVYVPPAIVLGVGHLLAFDPRLALRLNAYEPLLLWIGVSLLLLLATLTVVFAGFTRVGAPARTALAAARRAVPRLAGVGLDTWAVFGLVAVGLVMRLKDLVTEPLHHDEAHELNLIEGVLERGYPSLVIEGRVKQVFTSELVFYLKAPFIWLFGPGELGMRLPEALLGALTIYLVYRAGKALHGARTGLLAAAVYAVLPSAIGMTHHGRYPTYTQFFALLTLVLAFCAVRGGRLRPRLYGLAVGAFLATYLSWEGAALFLPALSAGLLVLTRPHFGWLKRGVVWAGVGVVAAVVITQFSLRIISQADWPTYGSAINDISLTPLWRYPFYDPWAYVPNFLLIENNLLLSIATVLGVPLWFSRSRTGRTLAFLGVTLVVVLVLATNFLEVANWRYVYYVLPLLILSASMGLVVAFDRLKAASARATAVGRWLRGTTAVTAMAAALALVVLSTTLVVKLYDLPYAYAAQYTRLGARYNSDLAGVAAYLRENRRPGDLVVAVSPQVLARYQVDPEYYVQTQLRLPLLVGSGGSDGSVGPVSRKTGAATLMDPAELRETFARGGRVWLVSFTATRPNPEITTLLTASAPVAYQSWQAEVRLLGPGR